MGQLYPPSQEWRPNAISNAIPNALYFSNQPELNLSTTIVGLLTFTTRGPSGTGMYIDWGDGSALEWIAHIGASNVVTDHNYAGAGTKNIKFTGRLDLVSRFTCIDASLGGDISAFNILITTDYLGVNTTAISGDISGFYMPELVYLFLNGTSVTGDIGDLAVNTKLGVLHIYTTSITGDIGGLSTLNFTYLHAAVTSVTGDIGDLATLVNLTNFHMYSNSLDYNSTTLPSWSNCSISLQTTTLTSTEVDNFLIDLAAASGTNGTLNIAGSNAARTSASDAAKATLLANGWALTVNE